MINLKKDSGDATLILAIFSIPILVSVMIFILNIAQTNSANNELKNITQDAANRAVTKVNAYGSLNKSSMVEVLRFYEENTESLPAGETSFLLTPESNSPLCVKDIKDSSGAVIGSDVPYVITMKLEKERTNAGDKPETASYRFTGDIGSLDIENLSDLTLKFKDSDGAIKFATDEDRFQVINLDVYYNIQDFWTFPGQDSCRTHNVNVSSVTFGSSGDVDYDEDFSRSALEELDWLAGEYWGK